MSDSDQIPPQDEAAMLAAEYVLRLLAPEEERAFEARLQAEPALHSLVLEWSERFSGMDEEFASATPRPALKGQVMAALFGAPERSVPFWERLGLWQGLSFASMLLAGFFAWQALRPVVPVSPERGPLYVSEIAAQDQSLRVLAVYDGASGQLQINRTAGQAAAGRVLELWAIAGSNAPVSLGVLPEAQTAGVALPEAFRAQVAGLTLAISDEPPGGSPTGQPTGAVLAVGTVTQL